MPTPFSWPLAVPPTNPDTGFGGLSTDSGVNRQPSQNPGQRPYRGPAAMRYEGRSRDWPLNSRGAYRSVHPVDQGMALSVLVRQGTIKSSPTTGSTLHEIEYLGGTDLQSDVEDRIRRSQPCARYLAEGRVLLKRVDVQSSRNGLQVAVYYVNLAIDPTEEKSVKYYT